jgi:transposase
MLGIRLNDWKTMPTVWRRYLALLHVAASVLVVIVVRWPKLREHRAEAEKFYRDLAAQGMTVRLGMEASGHARWFEGLLAELQCELWTGDAAAIHAKRVRKQKTDRQDAQLILRLMLKDDFPQIEPWLAEQKQQQQLQRERNGALFGVHGVVCSRSD